MEFGQMGSYLPPDGPEHGTDKLIKFEMMMIFLFVVTLVCTAGVLFVTVRFFNTFGAKDKLFSIFLVLLNCSLGGRIIFVVSSMFENWPGRGIRACNGREGFFSYLGTMFLSMAGLANIFIWIYFILSIKTYVQQKKKFKKMGYTITGYLIYPFILAIPVLYSVGLIWGGALPIEDTYNDNKLAALPVQRYMFILSSLIFGTLGMAFIWTGIWLRRELRHYNEDYEIRIRGKLIYSTCILSLPFLIRCFYNVIGAIIHIDQKMQSSIRNNTWTAPLIYTAYIIIADLLPITSQLISMLIVVDDVGSESYISSFIEKKSDTTEDDGSFLNGENDQQKLQVSANLLSTPTLLEDMQHKFRSTSTKGE